MGRIGSVRDLGGFKLGRNFNGWAFLYCVDAIMLHTCLTEQVYVLGSLGNLCCECINSPNWVLVQLVMCAENSQLCLLVLMSPDVRGCINLAFFCAWWKNTQSRGEVAPELVDMRCLSLSYSLEVNKDVSYFQCFLIWMERLQLVGLSPLKPR